MSYELKADCCKTKRQYIRVKLNSTSESNILTQDFRMHKNPTCRSHTVYIKDGIRDILSPIEVSAYAFTITYDGLMLIYFGYSSA